MATQSGVRSVSQQISNVGQGVPDLGQTQKFGSAIMDLLKRYQGIEKLPFAKQGLDAQSEQVKRLSFTDPSLIGADPGTQASVRGASSAAVQPTISGAAEAGQTFASRLNTFADVLNTAQNIQSKAEASALQAKAEAQNLIQSSLANFGPDAFNNAKPEEVSKIEKLAGVPAGYIAGVSRTIKAREEAEYKRQLSLKTAPQAANKQLVTDAQGNPTGYFDPESGTFTPYKGQPGAVNPDEEAFIKDAENQAKMSFAEPARQQLRTVFNSGLGGMFTANKGGKKPTQVDNIKPLQKTVAVINQLGDLQKSISQSVTGPIIGTLKKYNPYDFDARAIQAQLQAVVPNLARGVYGEVGVLTDADIRNYIQTLPNLRSTDQQNKFVMAMTLRTVLRNYESQLETLSGAGYDISGFQGQYKNLKKKVDDLDSQIGIGGTQAQQSKQSLSRSKIGGDPLGLFK